MALRKRGGNFLNLLQKEEGTQKGEGSLIKGGVPTLEETMSAQDLRSQIALPGLHIYLWECTQNVASSSLWKLKLYLVVQGKEQLDDSNHIVEASCKHFKPWHILQEWPNKQTHLELCHRNSGVLQRILNPIMLSNSTVGKCAPMQVIKQPDHGRTTEEQKWSSFQTMIHS